MKAIVDELTPKQHGLEIGYWIDNVRATQTILHGQPQPVLGEVIEIEDPMPAKKEPTPKKMESAKEA